MTSSFFIESALRSVLLALAVWIGLRIFSVRNVLAQKVAWGLVLASAVAMPIVLQLSEHWSVLPANVRVVIPADPETLLGELQARIQAKTALPPKASLAAPDPQNASSAKLSGENEGPDVEENLTAPAQARYHADAGPGSDLVSGSADGFAAVPASSRLRLVTVETPLPTPDPLWRRLSLLRLAVLAYLSVAGVLCARLLYGLMAALNVWRSARPVRLDSIQLDSSSLTSGLRLRVSDSISSPVTIGSAVVLPKDYRDWGVEKLRIVLAHERSHIRQGDFYLQLLAGFYAAAVWFSPLGWWLKRKLSDLAEAISDRAGLEEAADRASYAQILLEFAAAPRPTLIGVAMARHGSLTRRIERLLNDVSFCQAFAGTRRALAAVIVVPVALFAATTLVRVQASGQQPPAAPAVPVVPSADTAPEVAPLPPVPQEGVSNPDQIEPPAPAVAPQAPEKAISPKSSDNCPPQGVMAPPAPAHVPAVPAVPAPPVHAPAATIIAPVAPAHVPDVMILHAQPRIATLAVSPRVSASTPVVVLPRIAGFPTHASLAILAPSHLAFGEGHGYGTGQSTSTESGTVIASNNGKKSGYHYAYSSNGDSYAIVKGDGSMSFNGNLHSSDLDKARRQASGKDFLWFERGGKAYIVDDPSTLAQIEAMYKPMEDLGKQQEELGKKQEALGKQQEDLGKKQEAASVPTPDMSKEIAQIEESMTKLKAAQGKNMTQDQFADLQERLAELQGRLGEIQGQIGEKQGEFGAQMGALGEKMGALGEQMGELGERQGKIAEQADQKIRSIIDQSMKNGKAHPVQ